MSWLKQLYGYFLMLGWSAYVMISAGEPIVTSLVMGFGVGGSILLANHLFWVILKWCKK